MKKSNVKNITIVFLLSILFCNGSCITKNAENEKYILPTDFKGVVLILFNQEDGEGIEYDGSARVYRVPKNGVLKTQFQQGVGFRNVTYVRNEIELYYLKSNDSIISTQAINDSCFVFSGRTAKGKHWFSVGRINEMDSLAKHGLEMVNKF